MTIFDIPDPRVRAIFERLMIDSARLELGIRSYERATKRAVGTAPGAVLAVFGGDLLDFAHYSADSLRTLELTALMRAHTPHFKR